MMRFLRKGDRYALSKPIKKYYYQSLYSFQCLLLSLSTIYYQFSCNVQKSRARGTTGEGEKRKKQVGMKPSWSMASVMSFNTLLIHCYYFEHTWRILKPYTKNASARVAGWFGLASRLGRTLVHICSTGVRLLFECCSSVVRVRVEAQSKASRRAPEGLSNKCRSRLEAQSKDCRRALEGLSNNSRSRVEELMNRLSRFACNDGKIVNDLYMNQLILRWFESFCRGVRGKVESMLIKNKRSSQNGLNEVSGFLFDKESVQIAESVECLPKFPASRLNLKIGKKLSQFKFSIFGTSGRKRSDDIKKPMVYGLQFIAIFCVLFNFASVVEAKAQELRQGGATGIGEIKPLAVGQKVPEEFWTDSIAVYENGEIIKTTFGTYRGKPLLLDFWATWCSTCIAHMPELYNLDTYKNNELEIFPVTTEDGNKITAFVERVQRLNQLPFRTVVENNILPEYFKHYSVPFYVLLNADGMVQTMVGLADLNLEEIEQLAAQRDEFRVSDVTTNVKGYPAFLAEKYAAVPDFYYSYFFRGENSDLGGGNIRRKENGKIYSLSMLNITVREMFRSIARYRYEELGIPFHHSFIQFQANLPILTLLSSLEYSVPVSDKKSVPLQTMEMLNVHTGLDARFQQQKRPVRLIFDRNKLVDFSKIPASTLKSTALSGAVRKLFDDAIPVFDVSSQTNVVLPKLPTGSSLTSSELEDLGLGVQYIEIEFPILIIE